MLLELPKLPEVDHITNNGYETIYLRLVPFPEDQLEYNTTIKAYELDQGKVTLFYAVYFLSVSYPRANLVFKVLPTKK